MYIFFGQCVDSTVKIHIKNTNFQPLYEYHQITKRAYLQYFMLPPQTNHDFSDTFCYQIYCIKI